MSFQNAAVAKGPTCPSEYHNQEFRPGDKRLAMSPSSLKSFGQCPSRWVAGYHSPDSYSKDFGSLLDCLALTPELFDSRYSIHPTSYIAAAK